MGLDNFLRDSITNDDFIDFTLPQVLRYRSQYIPDKTAYIFLRDGENDEERISYRELDHTALVTARRLMEMNLGHERALMLYPPGLGFIKALFGCFYAGVIAAPAYPPRKNRSIERLKSMIIDSGARVVLTTTEILQSFERSFRDVEELKSLNWIATDALEISEGAVLPEEALSTVQPNWLPEDIALLQYTSGSTGQPKGVMVTHRNIMRNAEFIRQSFALSQKSVSVTWLPSFHDMGLIDGVLEPVYTGFPGVIIPPVNFLQKPIRWLQAITKYKGTHGGGPNFAFELCVSGVPEEERAGIDLTSMNTLYCGAEPIRQVTFEKFTAYYRDFGFTKNALYPCFGMAETTLITTGPHAGRGPVYLSLSGKHLEHNEVLPVAASEDGAIVLVGVGYPWLDTRVKIVNPDTMRLCEENEVGEIWVSGSIVTKGYWNKPDENRRVFQAHLAEYPEIPFLRTGDLGFFHQGELYISGRLKDLIIIQGRNIYPQDVEFLAESSHPALRPNASAAFSVEVDGEEKMVIVAEVERSAIRELDVVSVSDAIRQRISEEMELAVYSIQLLRTASILKTSSGKIQRKACKEAFLNRQLDVLGESLTGNKFHEESEAEISLNLVTMEAWLISWINEQLKIPLERIDLSKPITVYGLTSMKAIQLQQDFLNTYGVNFPPYLFFEKIPVRALGERAYKLLMEI